MRDDVAWQIFLVAVQIDPEPSLLLIRLELSVSAGTKSAGCEGAIVQIIRVVSCNTERRRIRNRIPRLLVKSLDVHPMRAAIAVKDVDPGLVADLHSDCGVVEVRENRQALHLG